MSLVSLHGKLDILSTNFVTTTLPQPTVSHGGSNQAQRLVTRSVCGTGHTWTRCKIVNKNFGIVKISTALRESTDGKDEKGSSTQGPESDAWLLTVNISIGMGSCRKGLRFNFKDRFDNWSLNPIRQIPDNSPIFKAIIDGDITEVQKLLDLGKASVYDVNENGDSLLHVSVPPTLSSDS